MPGIIWTRQPGFAASLNKTGIAVGLVSAPLMSARGYDDARRFVPSIDSGASIVPTQYGMALRSGSGPDGMDLSTSGGFSALIPVTQTSWHVMMLVRVNSLGTRRIFASDYSSAGTLESILIEQQAANTYRFVTTNTAAGPFTSSGGTVSVGWHWISYGANNNVQRATVDGVQIGSTATLTGTRRSGTDFRIGRGGAATTLPFDGDIAFFGLWQRYLSDDEQKRIRDNPWQIYQTLPRRAFGFSVTAATFQPAWAMASNAVIQSGARNAA